MFVSLNNHDNIIASNSKSGVSIESNGSWNVIKNNSIGYNVENGVFLLAGCNNNTIEHNNISLNMLNGITLEDQCRNNTVVDNLVAKNEAGGANLSASCDGNLIYANNFTQNELGNALDGGANNEWDNGTLGNSWSDYTGHDGNGDGIGDTPYAGGGNVVDDFPIFTIDDVAPFITINSPLPFAVFGKAPPSFNITVDEIHPSARWYSLNSGITNVSFTGDVGTISREVWIAIPNGSISLMFFANDTEGNVGSASVMFEVDKLPPIITINKPTNNSVHFRNPPEYAIVAIDAHLATVWVEFIVDNQTIIYVLTNSSGTIPSDIWNQVPFGVHRVRVCANDTLGNVAYMELVISKLWGGTIPGCPVEWKLIIIIAFIGLPVWWRYRVIFPSRKMNEVVRAQRG